MRALSLCCLVASLAVPRGLVAQGTPADGTPEAFARVKLEALRRGDYLAVAQRTDPAELRRTRAAFEPLIAADSVHYLAHRVFRLDSTAQVRRLTDAEFTARLMTFQLGLQGAAVYFRAVRGIEIIGVVRQGQDTAHVVYRWQFPADSLPLRSYQVETLVRCAAGWCGQMAGDYRGLIELLQEPMVPMRQQRPPAGESPNGALQPTA